MPLPVLIAPALVLLGADVDRLAVDSDPATVNIERQEDGRQLIRLPRLEFPLRIDARCGGGDKLQTLSISVADTRQTISGEDYPANDVLETTVSVSSRQIAPIAVEEFCVTDAPAGETRLLEKAFTAQLSLRCGIDESESVLFVAESLDVRLVCDAGEVAEVD